MVSIYRSAGYIETQQTSSSAISSWLASERPRERLLTKGAEQLSTAELLAVCIGSGGRGEDAVALSRRLLVEFSGLDGLLQAPVEALCKVNGLGQARSALLKAIHELTLRHTEELLSVEDQRPCMDSSRVVGRYLQRQLGQAEQEIFACMYLDTRNRLIKFEKAFYGSVNRAHVYPREILRRCMALNAAAVIFAHNHPSGSSEPSSADIRLTHELSDLLSKVDVKVLDHVIVAKREWVSLSARGLIAG